MKIHIVQKGETLWSIAKKYGVNFDELKKMNAQLSNPDMVMPGMKIKVPASAGAVPHHPHVHKEAHHHPHVHKEAHHHPHVHKEAQHHPHVHKEAQHHPHVHKEAPHHPHVHKEMPKAEHPFVQKKEAPMPVVKEIIKEVPKEVPYPIYQPIMPQYIPEIDINNYYTMNMQQMQAQIQQPLPPPPPMPEVKHEVEESPAMPPPPEMPMMPVQQPMYNYCYPMMPVMPFCDPCIPYQYQHMYHPQMMPYMMPQVQGAMTQPAPMPMPMPMPMPAQSQMPAMMPGMPVPGYGEMPQWEDESSSSSHFYGETQGWGNVNEAVMPSSQMPVYGTQVPYQQPMVGGFPAMPGAAYPMAGVQPDCGCGGPAGYAQPYPYGAAPMASPYAMPYRIQPFPYEQALLRPEDAYAMPVQHDEEENDE